MESRWDGRDPHCDEAYHITCLADAYAHSGPEPLILPLSGHCPGCIKLLGPDTPRGSWAYVVRAVFRRKDMMVRLSLGTDPARTRHSSSKRTRPELGSPICSDSEDSFCAPSPVKGFYFRPPVALDSGSVTPPLPEWQTHAPAPSCASPPGRLLMDPLKRPGLLSTGTLLAALDSIDVSGSATPDLPSSHRPDSRQHPNRPLLGRERHRAKPARSAHQPSLTHVLFDSSEEDPQRSNRQSCSSKHVVRTTHSVVNLSSSDEA